MLTSNSTHICTILEQATEEQQYLVDLPASTPVTEAIAYCLQVERHIRQLLCLQSALSPLMDSKALHDEAPEQAAADRDSDNLAGQLQQLSIIGELVHKRACILTAGSPARY